MRVAFLFYIYTQIVEHEFFQKNIYKREKRNLR